MRTGEVFGCVCFSDRISYFWSRMSDSSGDGISGEVSIFLSIAFEGVFLRMRFMFYSMVILFSNYLKGYFRRYLMPVDGVTAQSS